MKKDTARINNSQGIRKGKSTIKKASRAGWAEAFAKAKREKSTDQLLDPETLSTSSWDEEEWEWK